MKKRIIIPIVAIGLSVCITFTALATAYIDKWKILVGDDDVVVSESDANKQQIDDTKSMLDFIKSDVKPQANTDPQAALAFDGKESTYWTAPSAGSATLQLDFDEMTVVNQIHLKEICEKEGGNSRSYRLDAWNGEEWVKIYNSDIIENYKLCAFDKIKTWAIRLVIEEGTETPISIAEMTAVNQPAVQKDEDFHVMAYIHHNAFGVGGNFKIEEEKLNVLTDVIFHGFATWRLDSNNKLYLSLNENIDDYIMQLKNAIGDKDVNIYFGIANGTDLVSDQAQLDTVAQQTLDFIVKYNLAGVEIDYEYPYSTAAHNAYNQFILTIGNLLHQNNKKLATAIGMWNNRFGDEQLAMIDYLNIMNYDSSSYYNHYHSTFKFAVDELNKAADRNYPTYKINLGVPFYGIRYNNPQGFSLNDAKNYSNFYDPEFDDPISETGFDIGANTLFGYYFNGVQMLRDKTAYAAASGCGGIMIWQLTGDSSYKGQASLIRAIGEAKEEYTYCNK